MREVGPVNWVHKGSTELARSYHPVGRTMLGKFKEIMGKDAVHHETLPDGTHITISNMGDFDKVIIDVTETIQGGGPFHGIATIPRSKEISHWGEPILEKPGTPLGQDSEIVFTDYYGEPFVDVNANGWKPLLDIEEMYYGNVSWSNADFSIILSYNASNRYLDDNIVVADYVYSRGKILCEKPNDPGAILGGWIRGVGVDEENGYLYLIVGKRDDVKFYRRPWFDNYVYTDKEMYDEVNNPNGWETIGNYQSPDPQVPNLMPWLFNASGNIAATTDASYIYKATFIENSIEFEVHDIGVKAIESISSEAPHQGYYDLVGMEHWFYTSTANSTDNLIYSPCGDNIWYGELCEGGRDCYDPDWYNHYGWRPLSGDNPSFGQTTLVRPNHGPEEPQRDWSWDITFVSGYSLSIQTDYNGGSYAWYKLGDGQSDYGWIIAVDWKGDELVWAWVDYIDYQNSDGNSNDTYTSGASYSYTTPVWGSTYGLLPPVCINTCYWYADSSGNTYTPCQGIKTDSDGYMDETRSWSGSGSTYLDTETSAHVKFSDGSVDIMLWGWDEESSSTEGYTGNYALSRHTDNSMIDWEVTLFNQTHSGIKRIESDIIRLVGGLIYAIDLRYGLLVWGDLKYEDTDYKKQALYSTLDIGFFEGYEPPKHNTIVTTEDVPQPEWPGYVNYNNSVNEDKDWTYTSGLYNVDRLVWSDYVWLSEYYKGKYIYTLTLWDSYSDTILGYFSGTNIGDIEAMTKVTGSEIRFDNLGLI